MSEKFDESVKLVFVGDEACGKSAMIHQLVTNRWSSESVPTITQEFTTYTHIDGQTIKIDLHEAAGTDEWRPFSYPETDVFVICFAINDPSSLESVQSKWFPEVRHFCSKVPVILVGNKADLRNDEETIEKLREMKRRPVTFDQGKITAKKFGAKVYKECSASTEDGLQEIFVLATRIGLSGESLKQDSSETLAKVVMNHETWRQRFEVANKAMVTEERLQELFRIVFKQGMEGNIYENALSVARDKGPKKSTIQSISQTIRKHLTTKPKKMQPALTIRDQEQEISVLRQQIRQLKSEKDRFSRMENMLEDLQDQFEQQLSQKQTASQRHDDETLSEDSVPADTSSSSSSDLEQKIQQLQDKFSRLQHEKQSELTSEKNSKIMGEMSGLRKELEDMKSKMVRLASTDEEKQMEQFKMRIADCLITPASRMHLGDVIGKGYFGQVHCGTLEQPDSKRLIQCAIKTLKADTLSAVQVQEFLDEATIMKDFDHCNVLSLYGVVFVENRPYVLLPMMANGDLKRYVETTPCGVEELVGYGQQIATGMAYLASRKFVHRDLAARNCMVDEEKTVKIADFGLARDIFEKDYYMIQDETRRLPWKWMAPECFKTWKFDSKSDVWSFGVTLWETLTRGQAPYEDVPMSNLQQYIKRGGRLEQPPLCPDEIYKLMLECWDKTPDNRPSFDAISSFISTFLQSTDTYSICLTNSEKPGTETCIKMTKSEEMDVQKSRDTAGDGALHAAVGKVVLRGRGAATHCGESIPSEAARGHSDQTNNSSVEHSHNQYSDRDLADVIRYHTRSIISQVECDDHLDYLFSRKVLDPDEYGRIADIQDNRNKMRKMLSILLSKEDPRWSSLFLESLRETSAGNELIGLLEDAVKDPVQIRKAFVE